jgi:hypothetical protein
MAVPGIPPRIDRRLLDRPLEVEGEIMVLTSEHLVAMSLS